MSAEAAVTLAPAAKEGSPAVRLPPGPRLPRWMQTLEFLFGGTRFLELCRRRYGGAVYMQTVFDQGFVMLFDPPLVRQVFQGPHEQPNAGEANQLLGPLLGSRSVLVLDGAEHLRHRRPMLPPFHGRRMQVYEDVVRDATDAEIDAWPRDEPFALLPSLQSLTLRVMVRAVFGYRPGRAEDELARRLRAMVAPVTRPRGMLSLFLAPRLGLNRGRRRFDEARQAVDELLYAEIEQRRGDRDLAQRDDVFSALLLAEDENGERLSANEVRDELVTLLVAGHETTATGLVWAFGVREDLYPQPERFRPERFLGPDAPDTCTWIPFGGGTRRCLGASFAQMEMRVALRRILQRKLRLTARRPERAQLRAITLAPKHGVRVSLAPAT